MEGHREGTGLSSYDASLVATGNIILDRLYLVTMTQPGHHINHPGSLGTTDLRPLGIIQPTSFRLVQYVPNRHPQGSRRVRVFSAPPGMNMGRYSRIYNKS